MLLFKPLVGLGNEISCISKCVHEVALNSNNLSSEIIDRASTTHSNHKPTYLRLVTLQTVRDRPPSRLVLCRRCFEGVISPALRGAYNRIFDLWQRYSSAARSHGQTGLTTDICFILTSQVICNRLDHFDVFLLMGRREDGHARCRKVSRYLFLLELFLKKCGGRRILMGGKSSIGNTLTTTSSPKVLKAQQVGSELILRAKLRMSN